MKEELKVLVQYRLAQAEESLELGIGFDLAKQGMSVK